MAHKPVIPLLSLETSFGALWFRKGKTVWVWSHSPKADNPSHPKVHRELLMCWMTRRKLFLQLHRNPHFCCRSSYRVIVTGLQLVDQVNWMHQWVHIIILSNLNYFKDSYRIHDDNLHFSSKSSARRGWTDRWVTTSLCGVFSST